MELERKALERWTDDKVLALLSIYAEDEPSHNTTSHRPWHHDCVSPAKTDVQNHVIPRVSGLICLTFVGLQAAVETHRQQEAEGSFRVK